MLDFSNSFDSKGPVSKDEGGEDFQNQMICLKYWW